MKVLPLLLLLSLYHTYSPFIRMALTCKSQEDAPWSEVKACWQISFYEPELFCYQAVYLIVLLNAIR